MSEYSTTDGHPNEDLARVLAGEIRMVNPVTGGEKGQKLARFDLLPPGPMTKVAEHYGIGAAKYADRNWEKGYEWSLSYAAMQRHLHAFWSGEDMDPETGSPHLAAAVFHGLALLEFSRTHPELDNRPVRPKRPERPAISPLDKLIREESKKWAGSIRDDLNQPIWSH